jgi:hypothetical protein
MSQIVLDDQLFDLDVLLPIARWSTVQRLRDLRPHEVIKDDRVPVLLRELRRPTFVTIDMGFYKRDLCDARYCLLCFPLRNDEQHRLPLLLRQALRLPELRTQAVRMGKVARISADHIDYWHLADEQSRRLFWPRPHR